MVYNGCIQMVGVNDENSAGNEHFKADLFTEDHRHACLSKFELKV